MRSGEECCPLHLHNEYHNLGFTAEKNSYDSVANRKQWSIFHICKLDEELTNLQNGHSLHQFPVEWGRKTVGHFLHEESSRVQHIPNPHFESPANCSSLPKLFPQERNKRTKQVHSFSKNWDIYSKYKTIAQNRIAPSNARWKEKECSNKQCTTLYNQL